MNVCIVTSKHVSYNPRVVKEADALSSAGHDVTVVTVCNNCAQAALDEGIMATRSWRLLTVNYRKQGFLETFRWLWFGIRQRLFSDYFTGITLGFGLAERGQGREYPELRRLACSLKADLYIAHHAECLGAAYAAARKHDARFAFDAEDFHSGMFAAPITEYVPAEFDLRKLLEESDHRPKGAEQRRIEYLERKYLPHCDHMTAASDGIGEAYSLKYDLPCPTTILNVFPLEKLPKHDKVANQAQDSIHHSPFTIHSLQGSIHHSPFTIHKLYWYSQVIGPGRGLEEAVQALALLVTPCELHLRGMPLPGFVEQLTALAVSLGVGERLIIHPPCPPDDLIAEAARYDVGLALENSVELNRLICVTNKIFTYMNAGLAIIATDTPGQRGIMAQAPDAGLSCRMNDVESLAMAVNRLLESPELLTSFRKESRRAAEERFNWRVESDTLVRLVGTNHKSFNAKTPRHRDAKNV